MAGTGHPTMSTKLRAIAVAAVVAVVGVAAPAGAQVGDPNPGGSAAALVNNIGVDQNSALGQVSTGSGWDLIDSGATMGDVDLATGSLLGEGGPRDTLTDAYMVSTTLMETGLADDAARRAAEDARRLAERRRQMRLPAGTPYAAEIEAAADRHGVDPAMLAAIAEVESAWNDDVIRCRRTSSAGARGMFQFMPATAASYGIDPCDPAQAADGAARMLSELHAKYGNWDLAFAAYNAGPRRVDECRCVPAITETQNYVRKVNDVWASNVARAASDSAQGAVGADGCPTSAPANTLRHGAERVGINQLCADAVANAATPEAAKAIKVALGPGFLGAPYSQPKRNSPGWYDCSSYVTRAYQAVGVNLAPPGQNAPTTASMVSGHSWSRRISTGEMRAGDFALTDAPGHVAMYLGNNWVVHTNRTGDISHVRNLYKSPELVLRVDPARA
jgi:cell wall-associated NlpC family hydrolase